MCVKHSTETKLRKLNMLNALISAVLFARQQSQYVRECVRVCVVWCGLYWCGVVWCGVVWCGLVWCGVVWCGVVWFGMVFFCVSR